MNRIFVDPPSIVYENNKLFAANDPVLNRDDSLAPYLKLREDFLSAGVELLTYDQVSRFTHKERAGDGYISLGMLRPIKELESSGLKLIAFYLMEPPLILPKLYELLPELTSVFEKVFVHNTKGDCYSLSDVNQLKLQKLYWPQPYNDVVEKYWRNTKREVKVVVINGNHRPVRLSNKELYSARIKWATALDNYMDIDLYGRGWDKILSRSSLWGGFLKNFFKIQKIYKGPCKSKLAVMSDYDYALCLENLEMDGYITEKIFDCFYSGAIPIYKGGADIERYIPKETFINLRNFNNAKDLSHYLLNLTSHEKNYYREAAREFLRGPEGQKYYTMIDSLR